MGWRLICVVVLVLIHGQAQSAPYSETMEFTEFVPCLGNASFCRPQLLASGQIDRDAPKRLEVILNSPDHPQTIVFDSPGGSLTAGIAIGRLIRREALNTVVGPEYAQEVFNEETLKTEMVMVASGVGCYSACAYAFMGGVSRTLVEEGRIGVHQFNGMDSASAESNAQLATAVISQYMQTMGVHRDLLDLASITEAADMAVIPRQYAQLYNLDNQSPPSAPWELKAMDDGEIMLSVDQQKRGADSRTVIALLRPAAQGFVSILVVQKDLRTPNEIEMAKLMDGQETRPTLCSELDRCVDLTPVEG